MSRSEVASTLGISPRSVSRLAESAVLQRVIVLGATRYRASDVQRIVESGAPRRAAA